VLQVDRGNGARIEILPRLTAVVVRPAGPRQAVLRIGALLAGAAGFAVSAVLVGPTVRRGLMQLQHLGLVGSVRSGALLLALAGLTVPPGVAWFLYRSADGDRRPGAPTAGRPRWGGRVLAVDPGSQVELLVSPAGAIRDAAASGVALVGTLVLAVRVTPLAWLGVGVLLGVTGVLTRRMLRPTVLVMNAYGFAVRSWRYRRRVAALWSEVDRVEPAPAGSVLVTLRPEAAPDRSPLQVELRGLGPEGAARVAELLTSYFDAHRRAASPDHGADQPQPL
jgi:hypothetical protein